MEKLRILAESAKALAPEKNHQSIFLPMKQIQQGVLENKEDRKKFRYAPRFVPAGQSTQMIVGATKESDLDILKMSNAMYQQPTMRRVYYSGYVSVNTYDPRLRPLLLSKAQQKRVAEEQQLMLDFQEE